MQSQKWLPRRLSKHIHRRISNNEKNMKPEMEAGRSRKPMAKNENLRDGGNRSNVMQN